MSATVSAEAIDLVRAELVVLLRDAGVVVGSIRPESSLIDDLALDSLKFVDLTLALERVFELDEFPMQDWVDLEAEKENGFLVASLALACEERRASRRTAALHASREGA
jgi:acyl carrier protein